MVHSPIYPFICTYVNTYYIIHIYIHTTQRISLCQSSCKHKALKSAAPKRQFCGSASNTKADFERKGLQETTIYDELPELHSSCHKLCVVMVVSNGLRSTLICSKFQILLKKHAPKPFKNAECYTQTDNCMLCIPHQLPLPHLQSLDPPLAPRITCFCIVFYDMFLHSG